MDIDFAKIAPHLTNPLVLAGFCLFLFYCALKVFAKTTSSSALSPTQSASIYRTLVGKLFWLAALCIVAGFSYAWFLASRDTRARADPRGPLTQQSGACSSNIVGNNNKTDVDCTDQQEGKKK